jgi:hypothetical protein
MSLDPLLHRLRDDLTPDSGQKNRVRALMKARIADPAVFAQAREELTPSESQHASVWGRVANRIDMPEVSGVMDRLKSFLEPSETQNLDIRTRLLSGLVPVQVRSSYRSTKWVAAFALVLVALRASPVLFLAPRTVAQSTVTLHPTRGEVELSLHNLWTPAHEEVTVSQPLQMRTGEGEATILLHDDGTIRLAPSTTVFLHDLTDRPEPAFEGATLTLNEGTVWVQGLLPQHLRSITIATPYGDVEVHAGSVSIKVDNGLSVSVWDRHATVRQNGQETTLIAGERARFDVGEAGQITRMNDGEYTQAWVTQNLQRDAVHRREIAQMQQERRAAEAGILPTSPLYTVKRVAERMDMLFTLDPEAKVQKQLENASTRLNEAAALIAEGSSGASVPLQEYKETVISLASGSGGNSVTQFLVRQQMAENAGELSASLPDDESYILKQAVLETSAELPVEVMDESDVQGALIVDRLDVLNRALTEGNTELAQETYDTLEPYLTALDDEGKLKPDVKKEAFQLLSSAAEKLEQTGTGVALETKIKPLLPEPPAPPVLRHLTDEEIDTVIRAMLRRIDVYTQEKSRSNQMVVELGRLKGHQDEGKILRRLYNVVSPELTRYVRSAIQQLRTQVIQDQAGSL